MSDWRYWITYTGKVRNARTEDEAKAVALGEVEDKFHYDQPRFPDIEVEEVGEGE